MFDKAKMLWKVIRRLRFDRMLLIFIIVYCIISLIIYFIEKEHPELLDELLMIIKKAKIFILKEAKETYDNIIKEISIS